MPELQTVDKLYKLNEAFSIGCLLPCKNSFEKQHSGLAAALTAGANAEPAIIRAVCFSLSARPAGVSAGSPPPVPFQERRETNPVVFPPHKRRQARGVDSYGTSGQLRSVEPAGGDELSACPMEYASPRMPLHSLGLSSVFRRFF